MNWITRVWAYPPVPTMPPEAMDAKMRIFLGRTGTLEAWEKMWRTAIDIGRGEGAAAGSIATLCVILGLAFASLAIYYLARRASHH